MERVILFTGAGTSAEAGIPTFRVDTEGKTAFWNGVSPGDVANMYTFRQNKELVCSFHNDFRTLIKNTEPSVFHFKVKEWQDELMKKSIELIILTQNVDDLFEKAGVRNVHHIHGDIRYMQCIAKNHLWFVGYEEQTPNVQCVKCNCRTCKPGVIFFNEHAPMYNFAYKLLKSLSSKDVLIVMGTSCNVFPIEQFLKYNGCFKVFSALTFPDSIEQTSFNHIVLEPCSTGIDNIKVLVENRMEELN